MKTKSMKIKTKRELNDFKINCVFDIKNTRVV